MTDTRPKILLTRPEAQSRELAARLRRRIGAEVRILVSPILEIVQLPFDLPVTPRFLVLTSIHGAEAVGSDPALAGLPAYCVGDRTAEVAAAAGAIARSAGGSADDLAALLKRIKPEGPGLHLRGRHAAANMADMLSSAGLETHSTISYEQQPRPLSPEALAWLEGRGTVILPVYSPRSARLLASECEGATAKLDVVAISRQAADAWPNPAEIGVIAAAPDGPSMEEAIVARLHGRSAC